MRVSSLFRRAGNLLGGLFSVEGEGESNMRAGNFLRVYSLSNRRAGNLLGGLFSVEGEVESNMRAGNLLEGLFSVEWGGESNRRAGNLSRLLGFIASNINDHTSTQIHYNHNV